MPVLHLGVIDIPYSAAPAKHRRKTGRGSAVSTGDVAGFLEARYHVMDHFVTMHGADIGAALRNSLVGAMESMMMGGPDTLNAFGEATSEIEDVFRKFLDAKEMDTLSYPGIPTKASLMGVSRRFKSGYTKNRAVRPSFVDTGLFQASFRAWVD